MALVGVELDTLLSEADALTTRPPVKINITTILIFLKELIV